MRGADALELARKYHPTAVSLDVFLPDMLGWTVLSQLKQDPMEKCYPSLAALPEKAGGVLVFTQPAESEKVVRDAAAQGITRVWLQQGAQSEAAVAFCLQNGMQVVSGKCIMMFAEPVSSVHGVHRWFARIFGQLPK